MLRRIYFKFHKRFRSAYCLHHQGVLMKAVSASETSVNFFRDYIATSHKTVNFECNDDFSGGQPCENGIVIQCLRGGFCRQHHWYLISGPISRVWGLAELATHLLAILPKTHNCFIQNKHIQTYKCVLFDHTSSPITVISLYERQRLARRLVIFFFFLNHY
jgi:hypothetical protein